MNPFALNLAFKGARSAISYFRRLDDDKQREIYDSVVEALKEGKVDDVSDLANIDELEGVFDAARREAGDLTRDAHDRLDRRRAAFAAAAPSREVRRKALKQEAKDAKKKSKGNAGSIVATVLGVAAAGAAAWAAWEFFLKDKLSGGKHAATYTRVAPREEKDSQGETTLVYSTRTEDDSRAAGSAGPLGEEPAERDEELLGSIDRQLNTLNTLDDDQRRSTR